MAIHDNYYTKTFRDDVGFHGLKQTAEHVAFIVRTLGLTAPQEVLDLACGFGRHSLELAARGYRVTGLDQSADFLDEARQTAAARGLQVRFEQQDMRQLAYEGSFDAVLSLATSLAFYDDATNLDILARVHRALRPGGVLLFDQSNLLHWTKRPMPERYSFDASTCVLSGRHVKQTPDGPVESGWDLRLYHLPELKSLLGGIGFNFVSSFGDLDGSAFTADSKRLVTIWRRDVHQTPQG